MSTQYKYARFLFIIMGVIGVLFFGQGNISEAAGAQPLVKKYAKDYLKVVDTDIKSQVTSPYNQNLKTIKSIRKVCSKARLTQCVSDMSDYNNELRAYNSQVKTEFKTTKTNVNRYLKDSQADIQGVSDIITVGVDNINDIIDQMAVVYADISSYFNEPGISVELVGSPSASVTYGEFSEDNDQVGFSIEFHITAVDGDIYVGGQGTTGESNAGITYTISSSTAATVILAELTSTASEGSNGTFMINEGDTETFTFDVLIQDASTTVADVAQRLTITGIKWDTDDDATPDQTYTDEAVIADFRTPSRTI